MEATSTPGIGHNRPPKAGTMRAVTCRECGVQFKTSHGTQCFCTNEHRAVFNNRRMKRGMELYDFVMSKRYQREHEKDARGVIDALAMGYRDEDVRSREGRLSWYPYREAVDGLPRLPGVADGR